MEPSKVSMMLEGLLNSLKEEEVQDLSRTFSRAVTLNMPCSGKQPLF